MKRILQSFIFMLIVVCGMQINQIAKAQDVDHQLWMNYALTIPINEKWSYGGDIGLRGLISNYEWNQFLIRPTLKYRINYTFSVSPAMAWFSTINRDAKNIHEFRLHQDFNAKWPDLSFAEFFYRIRVEQSWFYYESEDISNRFSLRLRGLIGMETADINLYNPEEPIYFQLIYEGFSTYSKEELEIFVNRTRLNIALGHRISEKFRYEFHYIRQGSRLISKDGIQVSQNIYRLRFYHQITK